jgi:hypothetical protein
MNSTEPGLAFWMPTMEATEAVMDCLPPKVRARVVQRLRQLAVMQEARGDTTASFYSRALSGERCPRPEQPKPKPTHLRLVVNN